MTTKALTFEALRLANVQRNKEWDRDGQIGALFRATEFGGEVGEVLNNVKKLERERMGIKGSRITLFELAKEMADVQITLDLLAMHYSIDLAEAVRLVFNSKSDEIGLKTRIE
jgi:NTP pyrophosphatase (non-canonical NTP hydrolase)